MKNIYPVDIHGNELFIGDQVILLESFLSCPQGTITTVREYFGENNKIVLNLKIDEDSYLGVPAEKVKKCK